MDVDGVLTDGSIIYDALGNELKAFNVKDGHGIKLLHHSHIATAIITGRKSPIVQKRAKELGITYVFEGCEDKLQAYERLKNELKLSDDEIAYIGDDVVDIEVMKKVGLPVAVSDAHSEIIEVALYVTKLPGGKGAVRELCDLILSSKKNNPNLTA